MHFSDKYLLLFVIRRAKSGISKVEEFQFYFSADLKVATTNFHDVPESAADQGSAEVKL